MKAGYLSEYFSGIAAKSLSAVEADVTRSHQHEINGVSDLKKIFGKAVGKQRYQAKFIYLTDMDDEPVIEEGFLTWYDAREKDPVRSEHRLYFPTTTPSLCAAKGDILVIAKQRNDSVLIIIAEKESTIANQILWLFGLSDLTHPGFSIREELESEQDRLEFASRLILEQIGIEVHASEETFLDDMLSRFNGQFPSTRIFSEYARNTLKDIDSRENPDTALMVWLEREEILFRTLERFIVADQLHNLHNTEDVDGFLSFSLSVQNRRKSRAGASLENHLEKIFIDNGIKHTRGAITENNCKPDFLFPSKEAYHDPTFNPLFLTMLGVKSTCKDRWRQVLAEADLIKHKHLLTLQAAISTNQLDEMKIKNLQLVIPKKIQATYTNSQQIWLMDTNAFINLVKENQLKISC